MHRASSLGFGICRTSIRTQHASVGPRQRKGRRRVDADCIGYRSGLGSYRSQQVTSSGARCRLPMSGRSHITVKSIGIGSRPRVSMCTQRNVAVGRGRWGNVGPAFPREHVVSGTDSSYQCVTTPLFELTLSRYCIFIFMYLCIYIILSEREKDLHSI